jgi:hypothetical protein
VSKEVFVMDRERIFKGKGLAVFVFSLTFIMTSALVGLFTKAMAADDSLYTSQFRLGACTFEPVGVNPYFNLTPGYQLVLEGQKSDGEGGFETVRLVISVLSQMQDIQLPGLGTISTRVVEEREWVDDELEEVSRNFFARCKETNDVYYFGEDVDIYDAGTIISHDGAWRAGENGAMPGIIMPGTFLLGSRYFQEVAPGVALDRAEHVLMGIGGTIQAGTFTECVAILETSPLDAAGALSYKFYCPEVGLVAEADVDGVLLLVQYGMDIFDISQ